MKKHKQILSFVLIAIMLVGVVPVKAVDVDTNIPEPIIEEYKNLFSITASLSIGSSGLAVCSGYAQTYSTTDKINLTVTLQRQNSSGSWSPVTSWHSTGYGSATIIGRYYVTSGYNYRSVTKASVYTSSGTYVETVLKYSAVVYY